MRRAQRQRPYASISKNVHSPWRPLKVWARGRMFRILFRHRARSSREVVLATEAASAALVARMKLESLRQVHRLSPCPTCLAGRQIKVKAVDVSGLRRAWPAPLFPHPWAGRRLHDDRDGLLVASADEGSHPFGRVADGAREFVEVLNWRVVLDDLPRHPDLLHVDLVRRAFVRQNHEPEYKPPTVTQAACGLVGCPAAPLGAMSMNMGVARRQ